MDPIPILISLEITKFYMFLVFHRSLVQNSHEKTSAVKICIVLLYFPLYQFHSLRNYGFELTLKYLFVWSFLTHLLNFELIFVCVCYLLNLSTSLP